MRQGLAELGSKPTSTNIYVHLYLWKHVDFEGVPALLVGKTHIAPCECSHLRLLSYRSSRPTHSCIHRNTDKPMYIFVIIFVYVHRIHGKTHMPSWNDPPFEITRISTYERLCKLVNNILEHCNKLSLTKYIYQSVLEILRFSLFLLALISVDFLIFFPFAR